MTKVPSLRNRRPESTSCSNKPMEKIQSARCGSVLSPRSLSLLLLSGWGRVERHRGRCSDEVRESDSPESAAAAGPLIYLFSCHHSSGDWGLQQWDLGFILFISRDFSSSPVNKTDPSLRGQFSSCSGAFSHFTGSSSADGVCPAVIN